MGNFRSKEDYLSKENDDHPDVTQENGENKEVPQKTERDEKGAESDRQDLPSATSDKLPTPKRRVVKRPVEEENNDANAVPTSNNALTPSQVFYEKSLEDKKLYLKSRDRLQEKQAIPKMQVSWAGSPAFTEKFIAGVNYSRRADFYQPPYTSQKTASLHLFERCNPTAKQLPQEVRSRMVEAKELYNLTKEANNDKLFEDLELKEQEKWVDVQFKLHREWINQAKMGLIYAGDKRKPVEKKNKNKKAKLEGKS